MMTAEAKNKIVRFVDNFVKISRPANDFKATPVLSVPKGVEALYQNDPNCNVFYVQSLFHMPHASVTIPITMTIVRDTAGDLTLFSSFRVSTQVEIDILKLGKIRHVVKLGQFHGAAGDAYFLRSPRFNNPEYWAIPNATVAEGLVVTKTLQDGGEGPIPGCTVSILSGYRYPECVIVIPGPKRVLITCDAILHMPTAEVVPEEYRQRFLEYGYLCKHDVPEPCSTWTRLAITFCGKDQLNKWYSRLCDMEWSAFISAHGPPSTNCGRAQTLEASKKKVLEMQPYDQ